MKLCNKPMPKAENGASRGTCKRPHSHTGLCGSKTCYLCGTALITKNQKKSGTCSKCGTLKSRRLYGHKEFKPQVAGSLYTFPCGCAGLLPKKRGTSSQFAVWTSKNWWCRISHILSQSRNEAKRWGHAAIPIDTPHPTIQEMMSDPNCERCGEPLSWAELGNGKTPHLHHNHETGEPLGFTHPVCNPRAMEQEIERLRLELLKKEAS